jgi:hypothetical protein
MLLRGMGIKEIYQKWCDCHTCLKLPFVTLGIVIACLYLL